VLIDFGIVNPPIWYYFHPMKTVSFKIDLGLYKWLEEQSRDLNCSKSEITREALLARRNSENSESVTARAGELVGKFKSGRKDSSHKKHLKGFGSCRRS
jgi:hypothetical protein